MSRLRSDIWVSAYLRRCAVEGAFAVLRRRGAAEAGAIFVKIDPLDGTAILFGPAPQSEVENGQRDGEDRLFVALHKEMRIEPGLAEESLKRQISFDSDLWIVEVEDRQARNFLDLAK